MTAKEDQKRLLDYTIADMKKDLRVFNWCTILGVLLVSSMVILGFFYNRDWSWWIVVSMVSGYAILTIFMVLINRFWLREAQRKRDLL